MGVYAVKYLYIDYSLRVLVWGVLKYAYCINILCQFYANFAIITCNNFMIYVYARNYCEIDLREQWVCTQNIIIVPECKKYNALYVNY